MYKITNLIGTTWRLDGYSILNLPANYGIFHISADGQYFVVDTDYSEEFIITAMACGYDTRQQPSPASCILLNENTSAFTEVIAYDLDGDTFAYGYEFTITGGTDISNSLFIDFINTYGTLVSGGEPPTAEGVKEKLQSLLTASNAKTGKSDANLTDAVNTLIEGYGQGGGCGECSGKHIIEVDQLPEVGEEGAIYNVNEFTNLAVVRIIEGYGGYADLMFNDGDMSGTIATSETFSTIEPSENMICYVTDIPEIYIYGEGAWHPLSELGVADGGCLGATNNIDEADTSTAGYYAFITSALYQYTHGQYKQLVTKGILTYETNNDGTCKVSGVENYHDTEIVIPTVSPSGDTVTSIGANAFVNCVGIESITIPDSVTSISAYAFSGCKSIASVTFGENSQLTSIGENAFYNFIGLKSITIPNSVTSIGENAFRACKNLESITIPNSVTSISGYAFGDCISLKSITIPNSVTNIDNCVFMNCIGLKSITIPDSVTSIDWAVFDNCRSLTSITFGNGVTSIDDYAFRTCSALTSITIPNSVTSIGADVFQGCAALIEVDNGIHYVNKWIVDCDSSVTAVTLRANTVGIADNAFYYHQSLTSVTIPDSVTIIGDDAFYYCSVLTSIAFLGTVAQWNAITKGERWNEGTSVTEVTCSDGTVTL